MAITKVGTISISAADRTSAAFAIPAGVVDDDVIVVGLHRESSSAITAPGSQGYATADPAETTGAITGNWYLTVLQTADASTTHTFTFASSWTQAQALILRGVDTTTLLDVADPPAGGTSTTTSLVAPASTVTTAGAWAVWFAGTFNDATKAWPATNDTYTITREFGSAADNLGMARAEYTAAGSVSAVTITLGASPGNALGKTLVVKPAAGGGGAQDTPELRGRPFGQHGQAQLHQLLAQ